MAFRRIGIVVFLAASALAPHPASAQATGAIAGTVRDSTGAVLPGVTVEASSPALIEKVRTAITDGQGNYKIVDLRPGTYAITITLTGFSTFKREGIELSAGFTATANGELKVGSVSETVTVTGASPIVDVQNARTQQVLKSEVMDALPAGTKNLAQFASLTLGAVSSVAGRNDVGGDKGELYNGIIIHGSADDGKANWDGMNTNVFFGNGGGVMRTYYFNTVGVQEVVVDTGGNTAEAETGGANANMVPKEGSNTLRVYAVGNFTNHSLSSSAVSSDLAARGALPQSTLKKIYDYGIGVGGPIRKDKLWFYTPNRWWGSQSFGLNNYFNKSTNPYAYVPDLTRPAYSDSYFRDNAVRLTWQVAAKHKLSQEEHEEHGCAAWASIVTGALESPEAANDTCYGPQILSQTTWSYTATNRLLLQAGASFLRQEVSFTAMTAENHSSFTAIGEPQWPGPANFSITDLATGYHWGALSGGITNYGVHDDSDNFNQRFAASYITGSHAFKAGMQTVQGHYDFNGMSYPGLNMVNYTFRSGAPVSLTQFAGPFLSQMRLTSVGVFAQDQWTLKRLTLNLGVRFDRFEAHTLAFDIPAGPFVPARHVDALPDLPDFKDISPRFGAAYDVFGNGKTSIKGAFGKYLFSQGGGLSQVLGPSLAIVQSVTRTWNDENGNFAPDCNLTVLTGNGECGQVNNLLFGQPFRSITLADDARSGWGARPYNYQASVQLQQEVRPGVGVSLGYFRTWWGNFTVLQNTAVTPSDFTRYCITAPLDARLGATSGQQICGFYDVNPNRFGQVNRVVTLASNFGTQQEIYNGVDLGFNARWGKGALLNGGVTLGRKTVDFCYANDRPDLTPQNSPANYARVDAFCRVTSPWWSGVGSQIKLQAIYPLPYGVVLSGTFKNLPGIPLNANQVLGNAQVAPSLGRNLAACPAAGACTATVTAALIPIGGTLTSSATVFDTRLNETDLRVSKNIRVARSRLQAILDIYNIFNARAPQGIVTTYNAAWLRPTSLLGGRLFKFGAQVDW